MSDSDPNPDLHVGPDLRQGWNRPENRRRGFHGAHLIFRRALMIRSRRVLRLDARPDPALAGLVASTGLTRTPGFSALVVVQGADVLFAEAAADFAIDRPHSIQSVTKMNMHLIAGQLIEQGLLELDAPAGRYLPELGSGYRKARIRDLLDMNVANDFSEDYSDPASDCYHEEEALGWRLPPDGQPEMTLHRFVCAIGGGSANTTGQALYKSANTDVLALIAARLTNLPAALAAICDAAGLSGALHISLSPEGVPALSGGGCLSALDLARFGLLFARRGHPVAAVGAAKGGPVGSPDYLRACLAAPGIPLPARPWQRYCGHLMTDGRRIGHAGYGGQYLMVDLETGRVAVYLGVIENDSGHDGKIMNGIVQTLTRLCGP